MTKAIYAGSFDILTIGHMDIINKASIMFNELNVLVCDNPKKTYTFSREGRVENIKCSLDPAKINVSVNYTNGLVYDYANAFGFHYLVRGIRNTTDMIEEIQLADINKELGGVDTIFIPCENNLRNVSSSLVKELLKYNKDISRYVPIYVKKHLDWTYNNG